MSISPVQHLNKGDVVVTSRGLGMVLDLLYSDGHKGKKVSGVVLEISGSKVELTGYSLWHARIRPCTPSDIARYRLNVGT